MRCVAVRTQAWRSDAMSEWHTKPGPARASLRGILCMEGKWIAAAMTPYEQWRR